MSITKRGEPLQINQALNRPRAKLGLDLSTWMVIVFVSVTAFLFGFRLLAILSFPMLAAGAWLVGAAGTDAGLDALRQRVKGLNKDIPLVIYCGCPPWGRCPNIRPAYEELHSMGFTQVKVLYLAQDFGADWVDKGYSVARGR